MLRAALPPAAVLAAALGGVALAQQDGPVVVSPRPDLEWLGLESIDLAVELEWRRDVDQVDPETGGRIRDVQDRFREILELSGRGYAGHPNLLQLDFLGRFWLTQRLLDFDSTLSQAQEDEFLLEYDVSGLFLRERPVSFTLYSRRNESDIDRQFGGTLEQIWTEYGARVNVRDEVFPTNVQIYRRELDQRDFGLSQNFLLEQNTVEADGRFVLGGGHALWWDFSFDDVDESGELQVPRTFERTEANVTHTLDFGDDEEHQLRSQFRYFDESDVLGFEQFRINERLRSRHTDDLTTWFDYTFEDLRRTAVTLQRQEATANLRHELFESLVTTGSVGGIKLDIPTDVFESDELFGEIDFDYTKRIPLGTFFAGADGAWSRVWQSDRGASIPVVDRAFTFGLTDLIIIDDDNIDEDSIRITDLTGTVVFSEFADYTVLALPDRVEIRRVLGGAIAPGETVLIDYDIGPEPGGRTTTIGLGADVRYTFTEGPLAGLSVYGRFFDQDEQLSEGLSLQDVPESDFSDLIYGVEYNAWKIYLKAEQQIRHGQGPFDSTLLEARYTEPLGRRSSLVLAGVYQEIDRTDVDIRTATTSISATWNQMITDRLRASLILLYQNVDGNVGFDSDAFEQQLDLNWRYRQTELYAQVRNRWRDNTGADDTFFQTITVGLRREF